MTRIGKRLTADYADAPGFVIDHWTIGVDPRNPRLLLNLAPMRRKSRSRTDLLCRLADPVQLQVCNRSQLGISRYQGAPILVRQRRGECVRVCNRIPSFQEGRLSILERWTLSYYPNSIGIARKCRGQGEGCSGVEQCVGNVIYRFIELWRTVGPDQHRQIREQSEEGRQGANRGCGYPRFFVQC